MNESSKPVTINIDGDIHSGMRELARKQRVFVSSLYEQAAEAFLNQSAGLKKLQKNEEKPLTLNVPKR